MKKILLLLLLSTPMLALCQTPSDSTEVYCMVLGTSKLLSKSLTISVDFGQKQSFWKDTGKIRDEDGKMKEFNSVIDALNYMSSQGWSFINAYGLTVGNQNVLHYVMHKKIPKTELTEEKPQ